MIKNVPKNLKFLRRKLEINQEEFAKIISLSSRAYSKIEVGSRPLKLEEAFKIETVFRLPNYWLLKNHFDSFVPKINDEIIDDFLPKIKKPKDENEIVLNQDEIDEIVQNRMKDFLNIEKTVQKILIKFYNEKHILIWSVTNHKYKNRVHFMLVEILKKINYNPNLKAKDKIKNEIINFNKNEFFITGVKQEILKLLENVDEEECRFLLINKNITIEKITEKINFIDQRINSFLKKDFFDITPIFFIKNNNERFNIKH